MEVGRLGPGPTAAVTRTFGSMQAHRVLGVVHMILGVVHRVLRYGCLERHPRTHIIFFGIVCFKRTHPRYPKTPSFSSMVCKNTEICKVGPISVRNSILSVMSNSAEGRSLVHFYQCDWNYCHQVSLQSLGSLGSLLSVCKSPLPSACVFSGP